jgi:hypothetical protein
MPRERIPLSQCFRLLCAAKRVERVGSDAGTVLGPGMTPSKNLVVGPLRIRAWGACAVEKVRAR